jgi:hypothetical protein
MNSPICSPWGWEGAPWGGRPRATRAFVRNKLCDVDALARTPGSLLNSSPPVSPGDPAFFELIN